MPLVAACSLVLQSFAYSDSSKILRLYTAEHGLRSVIAKGAQRPRSRFGGVLEPFTEGTAHIYLRDGRDLHTLGGFDLICSRQAVGRSLAAFAGASLLAEVVLRFATEEPNPRLYRTLATSWDRIASADESEVPSVVFAGAWGLVRLLGYQPELDACVSCGDALPPAAAARFDAVAGGVACADCRPRGRVLDAISRSELRRLVLGTADAPPPLTQPGLQRALLHIFLSTHLSKEHPLRSLDLFLRAF